MYQIKQIPEDFKVTELIDYTLNKEGKYYIFLLTKKEHTTIGAINTITQRLSINKKEINYAGLKDRNAVTVQYISILNRKNLKESYNFDNITLELKGFRDERLYPGCLSANLFNIVVRNIDYGPKKITRMINYFGEQRFSENNEEIGKAIIKKDFKKAMKLISESNTLPYDENETDIISNIRMLDKRLLMLYLQSYQSWLWNRCVEEYVKKNKEEIDIPLIGFGSDKDKTTETIMKKEGITPRDFIIRQMPELSIEGGKRAAFVDITGLEISKLEDDDLNPGKKKCHLSFSLPKGSYATECIKQMFSDQ
jgi:tRNA pseudouridine13 synthase